jgi:aminoglycoside phosphotransferase (APT) family kinase protein
VSVAESGSAPASDPELRQCLVRVLSEKSGSPPAIVGMARARSEHWGSYENEILTVRLAGGHHLQLFLKDFGRSKLPKDAAGQRREREMRVYAELLDGAELGTARFYGAHWDRAAPRFWLFLEYVDGEPLRYCGFEHWLAAAGWLGRLHGCFSGQQSRLRTCRFLIRHDAEFFFRAADRALEAVSGLSDPMARRLAGVLKGYDPVVAVLSREPDVLVHGSYRPQNVLVVRSSQPPRICPADWELAAFGRSTYDLAFLCDGFRSPELEELLDAYEREAGRFGLPRRDRDALRRELDCFRLHKTINSLGHLRQWPHPAKTAAKVVAAAEEIAGTLT